MCSWTKLQICQGIICQRYHMWTFSLFGARAIGQTLSPLSMDKLVSSSWVAELHGWHKVSDRCLLNEWGQKCIHWTLCASSQPWDISRTHAILFPSACSVPSFLLPTFRPCFHVISFTEVFLILHNSESILSSLGSCGSFVFYYETYHWPCFASSPISLGTSEREGKFLDFLCFLINIYHVTIFLVENMYLLKV